MTTLLEHRFCFNADDFAANLDGRLSGNQQKRTHRWLLMVGLTVVGHLGGGTVIWLNIALFLSRKGFSSLELAILIGLALIGTLPFVLLKPFRQTIRTLVRYRSLGMASLEDVNIADFRRVIRFPMPYYVLKLNDTRIVIHQRQMNALDPNDTYTIYYWTGQIPLFDFSPLLSIKGQITTTLEMTAFETAFDFVNSDLPANRDGQLGDDQRLRLRKMLCCYSGYLLLPATLSIGLLALLLAIFAFGGGSDELTLMAILLLPVGLYGFMGSSIVYQWIMSFKSGKIAVIKTFFNDPPEKRQPTKLQGGSVEYHQRVGKIGFILTQEQNRLVEANRQYRLYYFPAKVRQGSYLILAVEAVEQP